MVLTGSRKKKSFTLSDQKVCKFTKQINLVTLLLIFSYVMFNVWTELRMFTYLKHSRRSCRAYFPAWYSCPSITAVTVSESSTITATSLSLFPSMLRSLMLAEPAETQREEDELVDQQMAPRHLIPEN